MINDLKTGDILVLMDNITMLGYLPYKVLSYTKGQKFKVIFKSTYNGRNGYLNRYHVKIRSMDTNQLIVKSTLDNFVTIDDFLKNNRESKLKSIGI